MDEKIEKIKAFRVYVLRQLEDMTLQQLNHVPGGFNNNIIWNVGHLLCVQQNMCYVRAGLSTVVEDKYISPYLPGTKPEKFVDEQDTKELKKVFITSIETLQTDIDKNIFQRYSPSAMIPKVYGFEVNTIESALEYLLYYEGYHGGCIGALTRLV